MTGRVLLAALILALGAVVTVVNLMEGVALSFPLVLGLLLLVDGGLRLSMLAQDTDKPS